MVEFIAQHAVCVYVSCGIILIILLFFGGLALLGSRAKGAEKEKVLRPVFNALHAFHRGSSYEALPALKQAARQFPSKSQLYILIGDLVRNESPVKAVSLHKVLLFRKQLSAEEKASVLFSLGLDYIALEDDNKAISSLKQSVALDKQPQAFEELITIELRQKLWEDAIYHTRELNSLLDKPRDAGVTDIIVAAIDEARKKDASDEVRRWVIAYSKHESNTPFSMLLELLADLYDAKEERALAAAKDFLRDHPEDELTLRYLLMNARLGVPVSEQLDGPLKAAFIALHRDQPPASPADIVSLDKKTLLYYILFARTMTESEAKQLIGAAGDKTRLFECSACRTVYAEFALACTHCGLKLDVKLRTI